MGNKRRSKRRSQATTDGTQRARGAERPAARPSGSQSARRGPDRRVVALSVFSTALLFALLFSSIWIGERLYESLPYGPFPQSRVVSALFSLAIMFGGFMAVRAISSAIGRLLQQGR